MSSGWVKEMREAAEASEISLAKLASQLGYQYHPTLSSCERGTVMPADGVVAGYERILGLNPELRPWPTCSNKPGSSDTAMHGSRGEFKFHLSSWPKSEPRGTNSWPGERKGNPREALAQEPTLHGPTPRRRP